MTTSKRSRFPLAPDAVLALGLALSLAGCGEEPPEAPAELRPVRSVVVQNSDGADRVSFAGVARAGVESRLSFRVSGTAISVPVELGQRVPRGQVLARLDPTDLELRLEEAKAALAQGEATLRRAEADYDRVRALYENNNASKSDLDASRAAAESARAQVEAGNKQLAQARQQVGYTVLRAPQDGALAQVDVERNEFVQAGQTVFVLSYGERPEVQVAVPEVLISGITKGQAAEVHFDALPGRTYAAAVSEVGVAATSAATFEVTALLDEPGSEIRSGMAAEVTFRFPNPRGTSLVVPLVAVGEDRSGTFVFVLEDRGDGTGVARRRPVEVGDMTGDGLQVLSGLEAGETVITAGVRRLSEGMEVRLAPTVEGAS